MHKEPSKSIKTETTDKQDQANNKLNGNTVEKMHKSWPDALWVRWQENMGMIPWLVMNSVCSRVTFDIDGTISVIFTRVVLLRLSIWTILHVTVLSLCFSVVY